MSDKVDPTTYEITQRLNNLEREVEEWKKLTATLSARLNDLGLRLKQLERPKMTNDEALDTFDVLKRTDASMNLPGFAAKHGLNYEALRKARLRRQKRDKSR